METGKKFNKIFMLLPLASWTPVSAPTAAAVSPERTICPPPCKVASARVATAWAAASLRVQEQERGGRVKSNKGTALQQEKPSFCPFPGCLY